MPLKVIKVTDVEPNYIQGISLDGMTTGRLQKHPLTSFVIPGDILAYREASTPFPFIGNLTTEMHQKHSNIQTTYSFLIVGLLLLFGGFFWVVWPSYMRFYALAIPAFISAFVLIYGLILTRMVNSINKKALSEFEALQEEHKDVLEKSRQKRKEMAEI